MGGEGGGWTEAFASAGRLQRYRKGDVLFTEGATDGAVHALLEGSVRIGVATPSGRSVVLAIVGPGALLGELGAIDDRPRAATATALGNVVARVVDAGTFNVLLEEVPHLAARLLRELVGQVRDGSTLRADREEGDLTARVARCIDRLATRAAEFDRGGSASIELRQDDLAGLVGGTREEVNRALGRLRDAGLVVTSRGRIDVVDRRGLQDAGGRSL